MQHATQLDPWSPAPGDDGIQFLDDAAVELIEDSPRSPWEDLEDADTRVWIRPYAGL